MLDFDALLQPVSDSRPAGEDLSFSLEYDTIQEARRADDPSLEQGEWVTELKAADWPAVARQCSQLLRERSKDLRLAVWWTEAQARNHGIEGLTAGYRLLSGLCERYWDDLHPAVEDGDLEQRIGNLVWLITHSGDWLRQVPLTRAPQGRFGLADFELARSRPGGGDDDGPTLETMEAARRDTPHEFYLQLSNAMPLCQESLAALEQIVDERLGQDGPSFTALRDQLSRLDDTVQRFARDAGVLVDLAADTPAAADAAPGTVSAAPAQPSARNGEITSRAEAIAQLRNVANWFRRTEPHSPVAYLADKAAHWGEMPLHAWLKRVIRDDAVLGQLEDLLDVARPDGSDD